jgi:hypothetical protein
MTAHRRRLQPRASRSGQSADSDIAVAAHESARLCERGWLLRRYWRPCIDHRGVGGGARPPVAIAAFFARGGRRAERAPAAHHVPDGDDGEHEERYRAGEQHCIARELGPLVSQIYHDRYCNLTP